MKETEAPSDRDGRMVHHDPRASASRWDRIKKPPSELKPRSVACPYCAAPAGQDCRLDIPEPLGPITVGAFHQARYYVAYVQTLST